MAFTLESAVTASTAFCILVHSLGLSLPVALAVRSNAELVGGSNAIAQTKEKFYCHSFYQRDDELLPLIEGSPQRMVEMISLAHDLSLYFRSDG